MRQPFPAQPELGLTPIEQIVLPLKSRDELPPILAGLQWIWTHPTLKTEILALLEAKILAGKKATGRTGLDLWQILVLGIVRLGLDANYDRLEGGKMGSGCTFNPSYRTTVKGENLKPDPLSIPWQIRLHPFADFPGGLSLLGERPRLW